MTKEERAVAAMKKVRKEEDRRRAVMMGLKRAHPEIAASVQWAEATANSRELSCAIRELEDVLTSSARTFEEEEIEELIDITREW